ncbi:MAG TPA: SDR family oxidoreductase [Candidatus Acidoferrales bacterium]|jgi:NAD(P)-dependent dehydrogenase (short-subunit alcohol dehydrogenase family)|nr:SDR family oxidoreductase [Candidatus Acidoferrales bacterium]
MPDPNVNKTVVITGASSGIGRASVSQMIEAGWRVFATVRKPGDAERLRSESGPNVTPVMMDVTDRLSVMAAAAQVAPQVPGRGLNALVNVAGVGRVRPVESIAPADLQEIFDINVFGQLAVTQAFLPLLRTARGRIVNISSVGAHIAVPFGSLINASKAAFGIFNDTLRLELRPFGIAVSVIEPGAIRTPAVNKTLGDIESIIASLPPDAAARYGEMLLGFVSRAYEREMNGSSPDVVADAVRHALTARRPRIRYRVGKHARLLTTLPRVLPDRVLDALMLRIAGLPAEFGALAPTQPPKVEKRAA